MRRSTIDRRYRALMSRICSSAIAGRFVPLLLILTACAPAAAAASALASTLNESLSTGQCAARAAEAWLTSEFRTPSLKADERIPQSSDDRSTMPSGARLPASSATPNGAPWRLHAPALRASRPLRTSPSAPRAPPVPLL
jgi:hypothetical protein